MALDPKDFATAEVMERLCAESEALRHEMTLAQTPEEAKTLLTRWLKGIFEAPAPSPLQATLHAFTRVSSVDEVPKGFIVYKVGEHVWMKGGGSKDPEVLCEVTAILDDEIVLRPVRK